MPTIKINITADVPEHYAPVDNFAIEKKIAWVADRVSIFPKDLDRGIYRVTIVDVDIEVNESEIANVSQEATLDDIIEAILIKKSARNR